MESPVVTLRPDKDTGECEWLYGKDWQQQVQVISRLVIGNVNRCEPGRSLGNVVCWGNCDRHDDRSRWTGDTQLLTMQVYNFPKVLNGFKVRDTWAWTLPLCATLLHVRHVGLLSCWKIHIWSPTRSSILGYIVFSRFLMYWSIFKGLYRSFQHLLQTCIPSSIMFSLPCLIGPYMHLLLKHFSHLLRTYLTPGCKILTCRTAEQSLIFHTPMLIFIGKCKVSLKVDKINKWFLYWYITS